MSGLCVCVSVSLCLCVCVCVSMSVCLCLAFRNIAAEAAGGGPTELSLANPNQIVATLQSNTWPLASLNRAETFDLFPKLGCIMLNSDDTSSWPSMVTTACFFRKLQSATCSGGCVVRGSDDIANGTGRMDNADCFGSSLMDGSVESSVMQGASLALRCLTPSQFCHLSRFDMIVCAKSCTMTTNSS